jgi:hypothetical protein
MTQTHCSDAQILPGTFEEEFAKTPAIWLQLEPLFSQTQTQSSLGPFRAQFCVEAFEDEPAGKRGNGSKRMAYNALRCNQLASLCDMLAFAV